jgi:ketosteroid isomerase-like protein
MRIHSSTGLTASATSRAILAIAILLAWAGDGLLAQPPGVEQAVRQVEDRRIKALIDDDFATLDAVLADDLTYGHSNGVVDTKASYMETLRSGKTKYQTIERLPSVVRVYGDTAIVTGTATVGLRGQAAPFTLRYTLAYVMRDGQWRMVAWQSTRLP